MKKRILTVAVALVLALSLAVPALATDPAPIDAASSWARSGILSAINKGFVPADLQDKYTDVITRQEFCRMAVKWVEYVFDMNIDAILEKQDLQRNPNAFTDTNDSYILAAFALGVTAGMGNGLFVPNGQFSREQAATMIMNTCKAIGAAAGGSPNAGFADMSIAANWAHPGINFVRDNSIMAGTGNNNFDPKATYTREQSIVTFNNIDHTALLERAAREIAIGGKLVLVGDTHVYLSGLGIGEIEELARLTKVETLDLWDNYIDDISALAGLTTLTWLDLDDNFIEDIGALKGLINLGWLDLQSNDIEDITALGGLTKLTGLNINHNIIEDITALAGLTKLEGLVANDNYISDITALGGLTELVWLALEDNLIADISALGGLTKLEWLDLEGNNISDIGALKGLKNLETLFLSGNPLTQAQINELSAALPNCEIYFE